MDYQISVADSDIAFHCEAGETVLDAAERSGYSVPYSCRKGVCSTCEGGVVAGAGRSSVQGDVQGPAAHVLLCCLRPSSDMTIAPRKIDKREPVVRKTLDMSVYRVTQPAADVSIPELTSSRVGTAKLLAADSCAALSSRQPDRSIAIALTGGMADYD